ncbi:uncharacterized protein METZ01_LOCUS235534, partial [marine metagenome]
MTDLLIKQFSACLSSQSACQPQENFIFGVLSMSYVFLIEFSKSLL